MYHGPVLPEAPVHSCPSCISATPSEGRGKGRGKYIGKCKVNVKVEVEVKVKFTAGNNIFISSGNYKNLVAKLVEMYYSPCD
jgi:hypothetical protein